MKKIIDSLHPLERKVLPVLDKVKSVSAIANMTKLQEVEVMRALQWLQNKDIITINEDLKEIVELGSNGKKYASSGLPEKRFLSALKDKEIPVSSIDVSKDEVGVCLGVLRSKAAVNIRKDKELMASITDQGKKLLEKPSLEEKFLSLKFPIETKELKDEEKFALENLKKRKDIVKVSLLKSKHAELTELGEKLLKQGVKSDAIDRLTSSMLEKGGWKGKNFRRFDIKINVPSVFGGKKQPYRSFLDDVRKKFMSLGFTEMDGPIVESDFWDMDALFMPQFHSARDIHEAYYIKEPKYGKLDNALVSKVKEVHEKGGYGSKGWGYKFDVKRTQRLMLRTQGTACSARMLASKDLKIPGKYFGITRCFRYDVIDATHLVDFNQTEGIIVEEGLNIRHLFGLLRMLAKEFADTDEIKITPGYFPFTEPSCELFAKHPSLGWIELGGAGIFRPELCGALGVKVPVLAWGLGIDRIAMFKLGLKDIRQLFSHDLEFLRGARI